MLNHQKEQKSQGDNTLLLEGNAIVLNQFYQLFNPICEKLLTNVKSNPTIVNTDILIGTDPNTNLEIFKGSGKYGPYVKRLEEVDSKKWKFASIKDNQNIILENNNLNCRPCSKLGYNKCPKGHFKCMEEIDFSFVSELK